MLEDQPDPMTVTVEEAAALLGVSRSTGYELAARGELPTIRVRRRVLVPAKALADMLGVSLWDIRLALQTPRRAPATTTPSPCQGVGVS